MSTFTGTAGNDSFLGTQDYDYFYLDSGGNDTANGRGRGDSFQMGAELTAADDLDGGAGYDSVNLAGDYSGGLVLAGGTLRNIENIYFASGYSYNITAHDYTNTNSFGVNGYNLGAGDSLRFDGSAETTNSFSLTGGAGNDWLRGGDGSDSLYVSYGGKDTVFGGNGNDYIYDYYNGAVTSADRFNGGSGLDTLYLYADYSGGLTFSALTLTEIEQITMSGPYDYALVLHDAITPGGETLLVNAYLDASYGVRLNASQETDGFVSFIGSDSADLVSGGQRHDTLSGRMGRDTIRGGDGDDYISGGKQSDQLNGGTGGDTFAFEWNDSPAEPDLIKDLSNADAIDLSSIDVNPDPGIYQTFVFVTNFSDTPGEMRLGYNAETDQTRLLMDMDGDSAADMAIVIAGQHTGFDNFLL